MGYDEDFYSIKSRTFVISIHSEEKVGLSIEDAIFSKTDECALDIFMDRMLQENGAGDISKNSSAWKAFGHKSPDCPVTNFAFVNGGDTALQVTMTVSGDGQLFNPNDGVEQLLVPAGLMKHF